MNFNVRQVQGHLFRLTVSTACLCLSVLLYVSVDWSSAQHPASLDISSPEYDIDAIVPAISACNGFNPATVAKALDDTLTAKLPINGSAVDDFVCSIMTHNMTLTAKLECPTEISPRYADLPIKPSSLSNPKIKYFFALDLYQATHILLPLMGTIIETMRFLGPEYCALSIVEGRSTDGTYDILDRLKSELAAMGVRYYLSTNDLNPKAVWEDRIKHLSTLRNQALKPLTSAGVGKFSPYAADTTVLFINDIVLCVEDLLELLYQHQFQHAQMTCAFDWNAGGGSFYDSWVSRSMSGNLFFEITHDAKYWLTQDMFFDDPLNQERYARHLPLQVYSCWGGMVILDAAPFVQRKLEFRDHREGECHMGEPTLLAKDMWGQGMGKIVAVPAVNVAYEYKATREAKKARGYVHNRITSGNYKAEMERIKWVDEPPVRVKCMPLFNKQSWVEST
ncbi:hypothetical protein BO94DRAFT_532344 [Aspergillus sclerotioniger CBS 115572]|uniref:Alpha-1,3-mannosyltransferase CMT1 n=1 Tax=Aspergillus sclerotioniger CBS 115572 TaxID=1450535 RepID=A0A317XA65_9EURO|nr:hypothetical protein BO94DRAFT_532344 [Aspergillus sclerotioniger CBS 115572]PWY93410.1 hypothetical protein BO94DRAFT_532344 [Aspergillus sclerotioniger CBS 115572]